MRARCFLECPLSRQWVGRSHWCRTHGLQLTKLAQAVSEAAHVWRCACKKEQRCVPGCSHSSDHFLGFGSSYSNLVQCRDISAAFKNRVWIWYRPYPMFKCLWWPRPLGHFRKAKIKTACRKSGILRLVPYSFLSVSGTAWETMAAGLIQISL